MLRSYICKAQSPSSGLRRRLQAFGVGLAVGLPPFIVSLSVSCLFLLCLSVHAQEKQENHVLARQALKQAEWATQKHPLAGDRSALRRRVAILMSRIDLAAAAELCEGIPGALDAIRAREEVSVAIAAQDPAQAKAFMTTASRLFRDLTSDHQRNMEFSYFAMRVAAFAPKEAFQGAHAIKDEEMLEYTWREIARLHPRYALEDLKENPPPPMLRASRISVLLPAIAAEDLLEALALSDEIVDSLEKSQVLAEISLAAPAIDALGIAQRIPDDFLRAQAIRAAAEKLAATNPSTALEALNYISAERGPTLAGIALAARSQDRRQAAGLIAQIASPRTRVDALGLFLAALAGEDAAAAAAFEDSHSDIPAWALPALCSALAKTDAGSALSRARAIADPYSRELALAEIAGALAQQAPQLAKDILLEMENPHLRFPALRSLVSTIAVSDVEKASALTGLAGDHQQVQILLLDIARAAAPYDISGALQVLEICRLSPEKIDAVLDVAEIVAVSNLQQARAIAESVLKNSRADHALAAKLARSHRPTLAMKCANEIIDPLRRAYAFCDIAEVLLEGVDKSLPATLARPEIQRVVEPGGTAREGKFTAGQNTIDIISARPQALKIRLPDTKSGLYSVHYNGAGASLTWENLRPAVDGSVTLRDDYHLKPAQRLRCPSRGTKTMPAFFDDFTKANLTGKQVLPYGIPVSTFGGAGYISSAPSWLHRDRDSNFWLYQDLRPWRIVAFDAEFNYRFTLVFPTRILALDSDPQANLYVLQEGNLLSCFDRNGLPVAHWKLKKGRGRNEFMEAAGLAIDPQGEFLYLADRKLGRVLRFDLQMRPHPFHFVPWGWLGREDLSYLAIDAYHPESKYRLDRPSRLAIGPEGRLYVDCPYYIMRFDLTRGEQIPFGKNEVLGWGGTFSDSSHSISAAANGHWQEHCLAGIDSQGNIYVSDTTNIYIEAPRLQVFSSQGEFISTTDRKSQIFAADGNPVYVTPPLGLAFATAREEPRLWLVEGGGRVYECSDLISGGRLHLGPGTPGGQFDLTAADPRGFTVEAQAAPVIRKVEGKIATFAEGRQATHNCEAEQNTEIRNGKKSIWIPVRLGEPFRVTLWEEGREIPAADYLLEIETTPGPFGTHYDFFRVTNNSGHTWENIRFFAETRPGQ